MRMMKNKHNKKQPTTSLLRCSPVSLVLSTVVGCVFMIHLTMLYSRKYTVDLEVSSQLLTHHPIVHELERVEEENIHMPPPRKRSPRAIKRKPKTPTTLIEEFLDENSQIRHLFFPDTKTAFGPTKNDANDTSRRTFFPGKIWMDTEGNPIQAHGGGILFDERSNVYYWYGEYKDGPTYQTHKKGPARVDIIGVGCYSSKDLWTWKNEGVVLAAEETDEAHDLHKSNVLERPKVIYNSNTKKYVMWMHIDDANYTKASVGVATSDDPTGPFEYLYSKSPHGFDSRDMTVFKDDDNTAYLIYSSEDNSVLHIGPLTEDYLDVKPVMKRIMVGQHREAPAIFKHQRTYYMITSGCTGWAPNEALAHAAESVMGPWETLGNPCVGGNKVFRLTTFFAQSTFVMPLPGVPGAFIFMADRWNPADLRDSRYLWLPLIVGGPADRPLEFSFGFPMWSRVSVYWHRQWRLPSGGGKKIS
uniref:Glycosyl hydrolase family protein 43 n=1 Tax=Noccaea caerulescens TaxID=107243 RepID=A0A1J3HPJ7_NOCCA